MTIQFRRQLVVHQDYHALRLGSRYAVGVAPKHFVVELRDTQRYAMPCESAMGKRESAMVNGNTQCRTRIRYGKWEYAMPNANPLWEKRESAMVNGNTQCRTRIRYGKWEYEMPNANPLWEKRESAMVNGNTQCRTRIRYGKWEYEMPNSNTLW